MTYRDTPLRLPHTKVKVIAVVHCALMEGTSRIVSAPCGHLRPVPRWRVWSAPGGCSTSAVVRLDASVTCTRDNCVNLYSYGEALRQSQPTLSQRDTMRV